MQSDSGPSNDERLRKTAWLSKGLESLYASLSGRENDKSDVDFDVVVVGSGYGGAVALAALAGYAEDGRPLRLCLLERGNEYLPGAFPSRFADLPRHVRFSTNGRPRPRGTRSGLFDVRVGPDVHAIVANGLGGGSLINAGVLATPHASVFNDLRWPTRLRCHTNDLLERAKTMQRRLGAQPFDVALAKTRFMQRLSRNAVLLDIAVAREAGCNDDGIGMAGCVACGDCATGCNFGAKKSLDVNLLAAAKKKQGVSIYTGATVLTVEREDSHWLLTVVHTSDKLRRRETAPLCVRAGRVILAAGTFGSTEILARSERAGLALSPMLGHRFSTNGDTLSAIYATNEVAAAAADEETAYANRGVGPTIVGCIDERTGNPDTDLVIEDVSVPGPLRRAFEEIVVTAASLDALAIPDSRTHPARDGQPPSSDSNAVDRVRLQCTLLVAGIGHDSANGRLLLNAGLDPHDTTSGDGALRVEWPDLRDDPRFEKRQQRIEMLVKSSGLGGRVLANPMWRPLPAAVDGVISLPRGPLTTVHPLGGCTMGDDGALGVVDDLGRVYSGRGTAVHDGLVVLDGSIVPTSLGINPALMIATLAQRAVEVLRDEVWRFSLAEIQTTGNLSLPRPYLREPPPPRLAKPTRVIVLERLRGELDLDLGDGARRYAVELKLRSMPVELRSLMSPTPPGRIDVDPDKSELRLYEPLKAHAPVKLNEGDALFRATVHGELRLFAHAPSTALRRRLRALFAWLRNRGFRDTAQYLFQTLSRGSVAGESSTTLLDRLRMAWTLASHAGDERVLEYSLDAGTTGGASQLVGAIHGFKRLTYAFAANPWNQLQTVEIDAFPGYRKTAGIPAALTFDQTYAERADGLLLEIADQEDMPTTLADLASFGLFILRTLLHIHVWTFRKPDAPPDRSFNRLPGFLPGIPAPQITEFVVDTHPGAGGAPILARLTRYKGEGTPVLLIHGYSASGTTFAHPSVIDGGLAGYLCGKSKRDVWVLDLRSSCGMPSASVAWTFEQTGYIDIPLAIDHVLRATDTKSLDIVAHCMGAAMLTLALFGSYEPEEGKPDPQLALRKLLPSRIRRLVLAQVVPNLYMAQANITRAYLMRYLQNYLPLERYQFRPDEDSGVSASLLDRFLASVPYEEDEFRSENPIWPPGAIRSWVGTRHRMDALYGVTFKLSNMGAAVLDRIDDFFGTLNVRAITQVIHFAHSIRVTDVRGASSYLDETVVAGRVLFPIMSLHSTDNGLVDVSSAVAMEKFLKACPHQGHHVERLHGMGHQDSLIGLRAAETFQRIADFLEVSL